MSRICTSVLYELSYERKIADKPNKDELFDHRVVIATHTPGLDLCIGSRYIFLGV